jgi:hypothetical protein
MYFAKNSKRVEAADGKVNGEKGVQVTSNDET